jgi:hypothetical protein
VSQNPRPRFDIFFFFFQPLHRFFLQNLPRITTSATQTKILGGYTMKYRYFLLAAAGAVILGAGACGSHTANENRATRNIHRVENAVNRATHHRTDYNHRADYNRLNDNLAWEHEYVAGHEGELERETRRENTVRHENTVRRTAPRVGNTFQYDTETHRDRTANRPPNRVANRIDSVYGQPNTIGRAIYEGEIDAAPVFLQDESYGLNRLERKALKRKMKEEKGQPEVPAAPATPEPAAAPVFDVDNDDVHDVVDTATDEIDNVTDIQDPVTLPETIDTTPAVPDYTPPRGRTMK